VEYPTEGLDVMILDVGQQATSDQLASREAVEAQGNRYFHLVGEDLKRGAQLTVNLSDLPMGIVEPEAAPLAGVKEGEALKWLSLAMLALAIAFPFGYIALRRVATIIAPEVERRKLLMAIADLDDRFEASEIGEADYRKRRAAIKARLIELTGRTGAL
ncbi:MAG: hypothetical protein ACE5JL_19075, partial [Dehalococcoidia bacterium]